MKAKRRHELQHNVLDAELAKTIDFFKKHGWTIIWIILAVVAVWTMISMWRSSRADNRAHIEAEFAVVHARLDGVAGEKPDVLLGQLEEFIEQTDVPRVSALACVDAGMVCAMQAHKAARALSAGQASGASKRVIEAHRKEYNKHRDRARRYYERARDDLPDQHLAVAKAHFGLAVLAEMKADLLVGDKQKDERKKAFEVARTEYLAAGKIGSVKAHPVAARADQAIRRLFDAEGRLRPDYVSPMRMAKALPADPSTQPASRPASQPATRPTSRPATRPERN